MEDQAAAAVLVARAPLDVHAIARLLLRACVLAAAPASEEVEVVPTPLQLVLVVAELRKVLRGAAFERVALVQEVGVAFSILVLPKGPASS